MSTENEGTAVPPAPPVPPVPSASPAASPRQDGTPADRPPADGAAGPEATGPEATGPEATRPEPVRSDGAPQSSGPPEPYRAPQPPGQTPPPHQPHRAPAQPAYQAFPPPEPYGGDFRPPAAHPYGAHQGGHSAPDPSWPPPPPPAGPFYGGGGGDGRGGAWGASYQPPAPKPARGRGGLVAGLLVAALVAGGLGGGIGYTLARNNDDGASTTVTASDTGGAVKREPGTVADVAATALPSTVTIQAEGSNGEGGTGTGFVFDTQGHIVTNNHVVAEAVDGGRLSATFPDGKKYNAKVVGHAQGYDVAVIKLENAPSDLKPLPLGNSDKVAVGDSTIAIGAPFGLSNTVTTGIISAKNRPVASSDGSAGSKASYMSALQTDASINPGNSGGPLLDAKGNVIGINSAIQSTGSGGLGGAGQAGSIGLGFAIPVNQAQYVAKQLIKHGKPVYARIGASVSLEETTSGAKITEQGVSGSAPVEPGGPAASAGLKPGDVITKLDDQVIDSGPTLIGEIWTHKPGDKVTVTYERDGKQRTTDLTLGSKTGDD
ncbi:S1C family serine protease [Streptomyces sp. SHP 1-2]|uniref:S1C family serine protease n=1 Tax=Streptomyces sp. SHP 1-2 TaxID=2769489 RepID=UPI002237B895|nr:trypsin-like peptidase domain-containing protein [Streptomyces sp. SHP 1-2]MCW5250065.1 trypsin-like peptidase domain-containing protein [Streptomyces sp. SHP 1-2]